MPRHKLSHRLDINDEHTQRFLYFDLDHTGTTEDFHYIDLAACLSAINRRLYRQGRMYHVANVSVHDSAADLEIRFTTIPNNWTSARGWTMAYNAWRAQVADALENQPEGSPDVEGKWADFKVYMNNDHKDDVDKPKPVDCEGNALVMYAFGADNEWFYTQVQTRVDGTAYTNLNFVMCGAHNVANNGEIGVIKGLEDLWATQAYEPVDPAGFDESPILGMGLENKNEEILDAIMDENDQPPYSYLDMVGTTDNMPAPLTCRETSITTAENEMAMVGGFPVPLGLICVETKCGSSGNTVGICVELVPGKYQGVQSESYRHGK